MVLFFFSSRRRHTRSLCDWSSDVCSSDLSRIQPLDAPGRAIAHVEHAIVQPVRPAVPELDALRSDSISAPEGWTIHVAPLEAPFDFAVAFFERFAGWQHFALLRRPCAELAAARAP